WSHLMKPEKTKAAKEYTREQAIKALKNGADPNMFYDPENPLAKKDPKNPTNPRNHKNYHVRQRCWKMLGCPLPSDPEAQAKILKDLHLTIHEGIVMTQGRFKSLQQPPEPTPEQS